MVVQVITFPNFRHDGSMRYFVEKEGVTGDWEWNELTGIAQPDVRRSGFVQMIGPGLEIHNSCHVPDHGGLNCVVRFWCREVE